MAVPERLPRPRTFEDVCDRLERIETNIYLVQESVQSLSTLVVTRFGDPPAAATMRPATYPTELAGDLDELGRALSRRVMDPGEPRFTSERARAMIRDGIKAAQRDDKAAKWDAFVKTGLRVAIGVAIGIGVAMILAHFGVRP